jgi:hypothetical protein
MAATNPAKNNASRADYYISRKNWENLYGAFDWTGVSFLASLKDVHRFKSNNPAFAIYFCFSIDDESRKVCPLSLSKVQCSDNLPTKRPSTNSSTKSIGFSSQASIAYSIPATRVTATIAPYAYTDSKARTSERTT